MSERALTAQLFEAPRLRLAPFDLEHDPETISRWTHDPTYTQLTSPKPARPLTAAQVRKQWEGYEKEAKDKRNRFDFTLRLKADDRLVGTAHFESLEWNHGHAWLRLSLGDPADRGQGYGGEALRLLLRYAFHELNLFRLSAEAVADNPRGVAFLERHGFVVEVRRREAVYRAGQRWDELRLGLLREEWERANT